MSQPKILFHAAYFRRETTGCTQAVRPSLTTTDSVGTVTSLSVSKEGDEVVFEKPVSGRWVDYDATNQRDRETWTVNVSEFSPRLIELVLSHSTALSGGGATVTPGATITTKGWLRLVTTDDAGNSIMDTYLWCKLDIQSQEFPQTGYVGGVFNARKLYSAYNTSTLANIS